MGTSERGRRCACSIVARQAEAEKHTDAASRLPCLAVNNCSRVCVPITHTRAKLCDTHRVIQNIKIKVLLSCSIYFVVNMMQQVRI